MKKSQRLISKKVHEISHRNAAHKRAHTDIGRAILVTLAPLTLLGLAQSSAATAADRDNLSSLQWAREWPASTPLSLVTGADRVVSPAAALRSSSTNGVQSGRSLLAAPLLAVSSLTPDQLIASGPLSEANVIEALGTDSTAVGLNTHATGPRSLAVGSNVSATADSAVSIGYGNISSGVEATALGVHTEAGAERGLAVGWRSAVGPNATDSLAIGSMSSTAAASAGAIGKDNVVIGTGTYVLGNTNTAAGAGSFVLGNNVNATGSNSVVLGADSDGSLSNVVSVGNGSSQRRIVHVAAGIADTDAVNISQLKALGATTDANGAIANSFLAYDTPQKDLVTLGGGASGTLLTNVKAGALNAQSRDAVNGAQLSATNLAVTNLSQAATTMVSYADADKSTVNLGGAGGTVISNVKAGVADQDAVNVQQLAQQLKQAGLVDTSGNPLNALTYDSNADGTPDRTGVTLGGSGATVPVALRNVAAGRVQAGSTDAVNGDQLFKTVQLVSDIQGGVAMKYFASNTSLPVAQAAGADALAIGGNAQASAAGSVALGANSVADRRNSVSVGAAGQERQITNVKAGTADTDAVNVAQLKSTGIIDQNGKAATALTYDNSANGTADLGNMTLGKGIAGGTVIHNVAGGTLATDAVNVGQLNDAVGRVNNVATTIGAFFSADGNASTEAASASGTHAVATGAGASASGANAVAMGATSAASGTSATALGSGATASSANSVALGAGSVASRASSVSVGSVGAERQITNVAAGTTGTDAVNLDQLNKSANSTLSQANGYTDQRFNSTQQQINDLDRTARRGIASASALNVVTPYVPGRTMLNAGVASYRGQAALGIGVSRWNEKGNLNFNAGVASSGGNSTIVRAGVGYLFGG
jgi:trimeric autotransporter adhesin